MAAVSGAQRASAHSTSNTARSAPCVRLPLDGININPKIERHVRRRRADSPIDIRGHTDRIGTVA
jgi:hypothetical protein